MIRILHIFHEMANGGIERFVMNYYRHIDRTKIQFDFLVSVETRGYFDDEIKNLGGVIYHAYSLRKNPLKNYMDIARIIKDNHYLIVHRHTGSAFGYFDLHAAKYGGAEYLILHSHNNQAGNIILHKLCKIFLKIDCEKLACSQEAGEWLFGKNASFKVISNAIECDKFKFTYEVRKNIRHNWELENKFVIGHVGRFEKQKNHQRLLRIFKRIVDNENESILICVGVGSLLEDCKREAKKLGIQDKVLFLGERSDVNLLMQAFDVFLFPSLYEGFPFVLVEAQASGLFCITSEQVPKECNISGNFFHLNLEETDDVWAKEIVQCKGMVKSREKYASIMADKGFDINRNAIELCGYYESLR